MIDRSRGDFDQPHPPGAGVSFAERVGGPAAIELAAPLTAGAGFGGKSVSVKRVAGAFGDGRSRDGLSQRHQQVVR